MHEVRNSLPAAIDRPRLDAVIEPIARAHGAEVVDVELKSEANGWVLRVFVEKLGSSEQRLTTQQAAVDLDLCSQVAKELSPALDVLDLIPHRYHLEVSSPGIERTLRGETDFIRFAGQKAKVRVHTSVAGQKVLVGILGAIKDKKLELVDGSRTFEIALDNVSSARLVFEFGPAPKPKPGKKNPRR